MYHSRRMRNHSSNAKGGAIVRASKLVAEDERCRVRCSANKCKFTAQSSMSDIKSISCSSAACQVEQKDLSFLSPSSSAACQVERKDLSFLSPSSKCVSKHISSPSGVQIPLPENLDEPGLDIDINVGGVRNSITSTAYYRFRCRGSNGKLVDTDAEVSFRHFAPDAYPLSRRGHYRAQASRAHGPRNRNSLKYCMPSEALTFASPNPMCKGSSSKAPRKNDMAAQPLDRNTGVFAHGGNELEIVQRLPVSEPHLRAKGNLNASRCTGELHANGRGLLRRKWHAYASDSRGRKPVDLDVGFRGRDTNRVRTKSRYYLSKLACSSAVDALPPVSNSALSNSACLSNADVLPSAPRSVGLINQFQFKKGSRTLGVVGEKEVFGGGQGMIRQVKESNALGIQDDHHVQSQVQGGDELDVYTPTQSLFNHQRLSDIFPGDISFPFQRVQSFPYNYGQWDGNGATTQSGEQPRSSLWDTSPLDDGIPEFRGRVSEQRLSRGRRSLYESQNSQYSYTWSTLCEPQHTQPSFSAPPTRSPPLPRPPPSTTFQGGPIAMSSSTCRNTSTSSRSTVTIVQRRDESPLSSPTRPTVEGLTEILSALEHLERDEELTYEQIMMLEATLLLHGIGLHDQYRDMRMDIDNMSYEELLTLEERIGNVHTGLDEDSTKKCVQLETFRARNVPCGHLCQVAETKCSICQEEFKEAEELGSLKCGHGYHNACIKQWLSQKNQCPICKASART